MICSTFSGVERSRSVSSMRRTIAPPHPSAASQLYSAVLAPPMWSAPVGEGAKRTFLGSGGMLIGAHVSIAGGLPNAVARGVELECDAIQIFNQSSRQWKPQNHSDDQIAEFRDGIESSRIESVLIHAVYLINAASLEDEVRSKSLEALKAALALGDRIGAAGVVLHPGSQKQHDYEECMTAVGEAIRECLAETERCPLLLEDTAGAGGTLGRDLSELARLVELGGGDDRIGLCLDCCHLLASGFEVRERQALSEIVDELELKIGLDRLHGAPRQRLADAAGLKPRPPREPGRRRTGRPRPARVPLRAALRRPPRRARDAGPWPERHGPRPGRGPQGKAPAARRPAQPQALGAALGA